MASTMQAIAYFVSVNSKAGKNCTYQAPSIVYIYKQNVFYFEYFSESSKMEIKFEVVY